MRHARPEDLDRIDGLLEALREVEGLKERKRGNFTRKSRAFLHFHEHEGDVLADVRLGAEADAPFERFRVRTQAEQRTLLGRIRRALEGAPR